MIMRNLLHMEWASLALVADLSPAQAHEAWRVEFFNSTICCQEILLLRSITDAFQSDRLLSPALFNRFVQRFFKRKKRVSAAGAKGKWSMKAMEGMDHK